MSPTGDVTRLLARWQDGEPQALGTLVELVYGELKAVAGALLRDERAEHTLQPTALVNEVYLRLIGQQRVTWQNRAHFLGIAAQMMRRVLVDHARAREAAKRPRRAFQVALEDGIGAAEPRSCDLLALDQALEELTTFDQRLAQIIELRFFGGLSVEETAAALAISPATVKREWTVARAWLLRELEGDASA